MFDSFLEPGGLRIEFPAEPLAVRQTLLAVRAALEARRPGEDFDLFELVLAEVLNNVVEHAYPPGSVGTVELEIDCGADALGVLVIDHGLSFPAGAPPLTDFPPAEDLPEGGFGWPLIRSLSLDLQYQRCECSNRLSFRMAPLQAGGEHD